MAHSEYSESPEKYNFGNMNQFMKKNQMKHSVHSTNSKCKH